MILRQYLLPLIKYVLFIRENCKTLSLFYNVYTTLPPPIPELHNPGYAIMGMYYFLLIER